MTLRQVAGPGTCDDIETCPKVFVEDGEAVVQGYEINTETRDQLNLPAGENAVRLPQTVILEAADAIRGARP
jgi:hypothetical protein